MRLSRLVSIAVASVLLGVLAPLPPSGAQAAQTWEITQLTTDAHRHLQPQIDGDRMAWLGSDGTNYQVFTQKIGVDPGPVQLTTGASDNNWVQVSDGRVAWQGYDGATQQVYTQKIGVDAAPVQVSDDASGYGIWPQVSGDRVVWYGASGTLFTRKIGVDTSPILLTDMAPSTDSVQVSGDRIVWDAVAGSYRQVFTQKIGVDAYPVPLTTGQDHRLPQVSGDRIAWQGWDGSYWQVFTQKIGSESVAVQLTTLPRDSTGPQVSGDRIVWTSADQVFTQRIGSDAVAVQLTMGPSHPSDYRVSGDRVVWQGWDGANWQVYTQKVGVDPDAIQLTADAANHSQQQVSGDRIVWQGWDGANWQVFHGALVAEPNVPPVLNPIGPKFVNELSLFTFTATATEADGDPLTYSLGMGAPPGASITSGGVFTWTPSEAQGPGSYTIQFVVSDDKGAHDDEYVTITVNEVPDLATIDLEHDAAGVVFDRFVTGYSTAYSGGGYVYGRWTGTALKASFTGSSIKWIGPKQPGYGMADVYIDGAIAKWNVDCYAPDAEKTLSATLWESPALSDGPHTIEIRLSGQKNAASTGNVVVLDKFEVTGAAPSGLGTRIDDSTASPGYTGSWLPYINPTYFNKTYAYSRWTNAAFTVAFTGTRVSWIGPRTTNYGIADVYIDSVKVATVDCYRAELAYQGWREVIWQSNTLAAGPHTLVIRPTGTKHASATAANVVVDAIDVTP